MKAQRITQTTVSIFLLLVLFFGLTPIQSASATGSTWTPTNGPLGTARANHTATLLSNGKVLIVGGISGGPLGTAELYDPVAGTFSPARSLNYARTNHTATLLADGKVLVVGGQGGTILSSAEVYDPVGDTWTVVASLHTARFLHTATRLANGEVLVVGGENVQGGVSTVLTSAELYDPASNTWTATGSLNTRRQSHTATLLPDGQVLVAGGSKSSVFTAVNILATAELYDPTTGTWSTVTNNMNTPRYAHTATLLSNGKVLAVGGSTGDLLLNTAELYDPSGKTWTLTSGHLTYARYFHTATLLNYVNHQESVLFVGGTGDSGYVGTSELYDPAGGIWTTTPPLTDARRDHTATQLLDGNVLAVGGVGVGGSKLSSAELYNPTAPTNYPDVPHLLSPNGLTNVEPSYLWNYSSGATSYHLTVYSTDVSGTVTGTVIDNVLVNTSFCSGGVCTYHPIGNLTTGYYKFKVNASNSFGTSPDSDFMTFRVLADLNISGNAGVNGVTLTYYDVILKTPTFSGSSDYSFPVSYNWTGTITPSKLGYTFDPVSIPISTPVTADQSGLNFTATRIPVTISGNAGGVGAAGAILNYVVDGTPMTATVAGDGTYSLTVYWGWTGTVTPFKVGYVFTPLIRSYSNLQVNKPTENYSAAVTNFSISGSAGIVGATLSYTIDTTPMTTTSGINGAYSISVPAYWTGTITPSMTGYTFLPVNIPITKIPSNMTGQNFTAMVSLSGSLGVNGAGATVNYAGSTTGSTVAGVGGDYSFNIPVNWTGTITPSKFGYYFNPPSLTISVPVTANQSGLNFTTLQAHLIFLPLVLR